MIYGQGISHVDEVLNIAVENDIINKAGAWFSYNGDKIGQGLSAARNYLLDHPEVMNEVEEKIHALLFPQESNTQEETNSVEA